MPVQRERRSTLRMLLSTMTCVAAMQVAHVAVAQITPATSRPATSQPTTQVSLKFDNVPVIAVLDKFSSDFGFQIAVNDASSSDRVTLISQWPVPAEEAISLFNAALKPKGYTVQRNGKILKVVSLTKGKNGAPVFNGTELETIPDNDDIRTQVMPVGALDAVKLRTDLTPLLGDPTIAANAASNSLMMTDTGSNIRRIATIINAMNDRKGEDSTYKVMKLNYADADATSKLIMSLYNPTTGQNGQNPGGFGAGFRGFGGGGGGGGGGRGGGGGGRGGGGGGPFGGGGNPFAALLGGGGASQDDASQGKINAASDTRTNTVVVTGPRGLVAEVSTIVKEIDKPAAEATFFLYRVKNGQAIDMMSTLNGLFQQTGVSQSSSTLSRSTSFGASSSSGFGGGGGAGGRGGGGAGGRGGGGGGFGGGGGGFGGGGGGFGGGGGGNRGGGFGGGGGGFGGGGNRGSTGGQQSAIASMIGQVYVVADADTNSLLVTTATKFMDDVKKVIIELDRPVPQVLIKVLVAEVTHDNNDDIGTDFSVLNARPNGNGQSFGQTFGTPGTGLVANFLENNLNAQLHLLAQQNKLDVLSRPYILASDNQEAYVQVGQQVPIVTSNSTTALGQTISNYQYQPVGIILDVIPHINPDGIVTLQVAPQISQLTAQTVTVGPGVSVPVIASRQATSQVAIADGQTIVIGGLMQDQKTLTVNKIPLLGDIPFIGAAFSRIQYDKTKTELLLFLTPHVAQSPAALPSMSTDEMKGTQLVPKAVTPGTFQEHMDGMQRGRTVMPTSQP